MPRCRFVVLLVSLLLVAAAWRWTARDSARSLVALQQSSATARLGAIDSPVAVTSAERMRERAAYARAWDREQPAELAAFREWTSRYLTASPAARPDLIAEGVELARVRRPVMLSLIQSNPQQALAVTVPAAVRAQLPETVLAELERRVTGRGELALLAATPQTGEPAPAPLRRVALIAGTSYTAHVYGRRESQTGKAGASLHGIALDRELALHESPLRVLEPGEAPVAAADPLCPVTQLAAASGPDDSQAVQVEAFGHRWEFCGTTPDMPEQFERQLLLAEEGSGSNVPYPTTPQVAAEAVSNRTIGAQRVLVIRTDFSDFPGASVTAADAQNVMDNNVRPFFEEASYGLTTLVTTVSGAVYRLPQTGSAYALADNESQLHLDARTLAAADHTLANFDRIIVVFPNLGTARVPGSLITFGGEASISGSSIWINGTFSWQTVAHELGHTYGLYHANLWRVTDANPLSASGTTLEYGDPFDMMGSTSVTGVTRDIRHHFNHRFKNRLGWLPDASVITVTKSGTYRIYRFDHKDAAGPAQPMALRVFRDGVRWYWIGYRQNFPTGATATNGAYVLWTFNNNQQSQLLDLTTPGTSANDAVVPVGSTFSDAAYGVTIRPVARGGADPAQYLDVEITVPATPPGVLNAWGREGVLFYSGNTGAPVSPAPETSVPPGLTGVQAVAAGDAHVLALKSDGTVLAWGDTTNGQTAVPAGLANVVAVAAGGNVSGVVLADGTVRLWGEAVGGAVQPPANLTGVKQLAIGGSHSVGIYHVLALKTDGTIVSWGDNTRNQVTVPAGLTNVVAVAASDRLSVALKADGTVVRWGVTFTGAIAFPASLSGVTAIASSGGAEHVLALKADGTVVGWGVNSSGQATPPAGLNSVVAIATALSHSVALKADGTVVAWGSTAAGRTNVPFSLPRAHAIAASLQAGYAISGPHVYLLAQPQSQVAATGGGATFSVSATGGGTLRYQWRRAGVAIPGATASTLVLNSVAAADAEAYDVVVSDATSTITSFPARLTVLPPAVAVAPGRLINLSINTGISADDPFFTVGTVIGGAGTAGPKPLLIRAAGPSLVPFGVAAAMANPKLELFSGQTSAGINDDWGGGAALSNVFSQVGAFPFTAGTSRDAALFNGGLLPGNYTVQVSGVGGSTGTVIAELYDATASDRFTAATPRLINVSVLKKIGPGEVLTAGFVIGGSTSKQVLLRAVGPTLAAAPFNVGGTMADPKLELYGSGGVFLQGNDDWGGGSTLVTAAAGVGAFALGTTSRDAVMLVTLQPGNYTAQVSGVAGTNGLTLVEVYEVP